MDIELIKPFINHDVEVLVAGVWIEGHMAPIAKGVITLLPIGGSEQFYGPTACRADVIQAIRQVKRISTTSPVVNEPDSTKIKSSLDPNTPGKRFMVAK